MPEVDNSPDEQDQSETFDETHIDDEGDGDLMLDEVEGVFDVTQVDGDADEEPFDEDDIDLDDDLGASGIEAEADALLGADGFPLNKIDGESDGQQGENEVELVYTGLMRNERGAQASAGHWESKRLSDDDIADLGYGPDDKQEQAQ